MTVKVAPAMKNALLALLFTLLLPATAAAAVDKPGVSEIRQDGTVVTWVLGIPGDELTSLAGESKESIAGFMANNIRMSVDAESRRPRPQDPQSEH
jgi:hypothetical protein